MVVITSGINIILFINELPIGPWTESNETNSKEKISGMVLSWQRTEAVVLGTNAVGLALQPEKHYKLSSAHIY